MPPLLPKAWAAVKAGLAVESRYNGRMKQVLAIALILPTLSFAEGTVPDYSQLYPPMPGVDNYCTDAEGQRVELGQVICITASCTTWTAKCDMSLNNPTWRKIQDGCPAVSVIDRFKKVRSAS